MYSSCAYRKGFRADARGEEANIIFFFKFFGGILIFFVLYSTLLHLPPLRFHCADGCWDRTQDRQLQLHGALAVRRSNHQIYNMVTCRRISTLLSFIIWFDSFSNEKKFSVHRAEFCMDASGETVWNKKCRTLDSEATNVDNCLQFYFLIVLWINTWKIRKRTFLTHNGNNLRFSFHH